MTQLPNILPVLPEIAVAGGALILLAAGAAVRRDSFSGTIAAGGLLALILAMVLVLLGLYQPRQVVFGGMIIVDRFAVFAKLLILAGAMAALVMARDWMRRERLERFEVVILILFATLGMMMMVSANSLMTLYLGLELQSLSLYILTAFDREDSRSVEAGMKYFVLGALASGLLLYGMSLVYGFAGSLSFADFGHAVTADSPMGVRIGLIFILAGLAFKISAVPFHMWTPDVYEGAPTPMTAFFATAPKVAAFALLIRVLLGPFGALIGDWTPIISLLAVLSMVLGGFAAIAQKNIKRMLAYGAIGHAGYALIGLAAGNGQGVSAVLIYLAIYLFMTAGAFAVILALRRDGRTAEEIGDFAGLAKSRPFMAFCLSMFMFSMAGIPPLAGFWGKFYVFMAAIDRGMYGLALVGVLTSVVAAFYYLRVVKIIYVDEERETPDRETDAGLRIVMAICVLVVLGMTLTPSSLTDGAALAAAVLFKG
ncbi:MAG: NADH-quinone oxidoreductase subunit NuoN [Rhodospirillaceae bacterium]|nr:NADH-quinone oxidoreductase subunit NuoN [Rhodospirillaceae bacterium]